MNKIINLLVSDHIFALFAFGFVFIFFSIFMYLVFYIYLNINLRGICKIIFNNEKKYSSPLEPFDFIALSFLPTTFWREVLNIKYNKSFKKLYGKEFYYQLDKRQLVELLGRYRFYFIFQYVVFMSSGLGLLLLVAGYIAHQGL
ncbi:hypothetical protein [Acinetobacter sp. NIPH 2699]|uniref:hypothetical protein n=1 Tax=Acinetobacter sp. NIPH 2699 TaxID=2923433 RepID=UPI001F4BE602|nr:hypothetical protein [Acinetobacter sp. NIPH 2699]MCH7337900.1 hypothetical protein [Acinetobacter sp. NIPH 2699]